MTPLWNISVGYCGPTDCCLVLRHPDGREKEYLIESDAWKALGVLRSTSEGWITVCSDWAAICQIIWDKQDKDMRSSE